MEDKLIKQLHKNSWKIRNGWGDRSQGKNNNRIWEAEELIETK